MRVLLVQPPIKMSDWFGRKTAALPAMQEPTIGYLLMKRCYSGGQAIALDMIALCVPEHHEVRILNLCRESDGALEQEIAAYQPHLVGVTCTFTCGTNNALRTARQVRTAAPETFIIVGGHAPTLAPETFDIEQVDAIAIGEGEVILPLLLDRLERGIEWRDLPGLAYRVGGTLRLPPAGPMLVDDLDTLPLAKHCLMACASGEPDDSPEQVGSVYSSRGCPFRCSFCAVSQMYRGRFRWMSAERAGQAIENTPAPLIAFLDDTFLSHIPRARRIAELLLERGVQKKYFYQCRADSVVHHPDVVALWRQAGLNDVFLGVESVDNARLAEMRKGSTVDINSRAVEVLHRYNVRVSAGLIIEPTFDEQDFDRLRRFIVETRIDLPYFNILTPFPGTELWDQRSNELTTRDWDCFNGNHVVLPTRLPLLEFYRLCFQLVTEMWARGDM